MAPEQVCPGAQARVVAGRYALGPVIGVGSSAVVHRARDLQGHREVAVKCFRPGATADDLRQLRQEMRVLAHLHHPGLVVLHDGGSEDGRAFVVTDLVEGPTLAERIADGPPLAPGAVRRLGAQLAAALAHVHTAGIVHRDIKPANVLLGDGRRPRLADFGIARSFDATAATTSGCVVGTAAYLAPEQVRGETVGPAADVYALGLVLLESLTGRREYPGAAIESATARLYRRPVVPSGLPGGLGTVLVAMTQGDPRRRPTAAQIAVALSADPSSPAAALQSTARAAGRAARHGRHRLHRMAGYRIPLLVVTAAAVAIPAAADSAIPRVAPTSTVTAATASEPSP